MKANCQLLLLSMLPCATAAIAQSPELRVTPFVVHGQSVDLVLFAPPGASSVTLFDVSGGPSRFLGATYHLGLTAGLGVLDAGLVGTGGFRTARIPTSLGAPLGVPLYLQSVLIEPSAVSPLVPSDGESCVVWSSSSALIEDYDDPIAMGLSGSFDAAVRGRVQASPARTRIHDRAPTGGFEFAQPLAGPLNAFGVRTQSVYRATDLGSTGDPERLVAIRWRPKLGVTPDVFHNLSIDVAHSHVVPDYVVDPWTALPRSPASGLGLSFAANVKAGETPQRLFRGDYQIAPADLRRDGYMPFPVIRPFDWNGVDSLLVDFRTPPDAAASGANGLRVFLMVLSSPQPNARVTASGRAGSTVDPYAVTVAQLGDNTYYDLQFEFVRVQSVALSRWLASPVATPDWSTPISSISQPAGSDIALEFRGARDAFGQTATAWSADIDAFDGYAFLQYRIRFTVVPGAATLPSVDQLVIPYR